jgi:hypothetical protein
MRHERSCLCARAQVNVCVCWRKSANAGAHYDTCVHAVREQLLNVVRHCAILGSASALLERTPTWNILLSENFFSYRCCFLVLVLVPARPEKSHGKLVYWVGLTGAFGGGGFPRGLHADTISGTRFFTQHIYTAYVLCERRRKYFESVVCRGRSSVSRTFSTPSFLFFAEMFFIYEMRKTKMNCLPCIISV